MPRSSTITLQNARYLAFKAHADGTDQAELHGDCSAPVDLEMRGVQQLLAPRLTEWAQNDNHDYAEGYGYLGPGFKPPVTRTVYIRVRCRKCPQCLQQKRRQWTARAFQEVRNVERTWFGTLTVAPEYRFRAKAMAERTTERTRFETFDKLTPTERTKAIAKELTPEVTRWLKRVRKASGAKIRYVLVVEPHKDGFPHFHLLVHEVSGTVTKRQLEGQWRIGLTHWRLVSQDEKEVAYVCKYITKSAQTRVRASRNYGQPDITALTERLRDAVLTIGSNRKTTRLSNQTKKELNEEKSLTHNTL